MKKLDCDDCSAAYVGKYKDSCKKSNRRCLAHLPSGLNVDFDRYEHLILSEIKGSLPSETYYKKSEIIEPRYDKWLTKDVRQRPDLIIRSPLEGSNIVIVEVDEGYHDDPDKRRLDKEREEYFRSKLTEEYKKYGNPSPSVSFVRIEPFDGKIDTIVDKIQKTTISPGKKSKKVIKTGEFEGVLKTSISEIRKKLTRRTRGTETLKITPHNYKDIDSKPRSPLGPRYSKIFPRRRSTLEIEDVESVKVKSPISPLGLPKKLSPKIHLSGGIPGYKLSGYKKDGVTKCRAHHHCELTYTGSNVLHSNYRISDDDNGKKSISTRPLPKKLSPDASKPLHRVRAILVDENDPLSPPYSPTNPVYSPTSPMYIPTTPEKKKSISPLGLPKKLSPKIHLSGGIPGYKLSGYKKDGVTKCRTHRHCELTYTGSNVLHSNYRISDDDNGKKSISPPLLPEKLSPESLKRLERANIHSANIRKMIREQSRQEDLEREKEYNSYKSSILRWFGF